MNDPVGVVLIAVAIYCGLRSIADAIRWRGGNRTVIVRHEFTEGDDGPR